VSNKVLYLLLKSGGYIFIVFSAEVLFYCDYLAGETLRVLSTKTAIFLPK
jgi:hypothetical protein